MPRAGFTARGILLFRARSSSAAPVRSSTLGKTDFGSNAEFLDLDARYSLGAAKYNPQDTDVRSVYDVVLVGSDSHYTSRGYGTLGYHLNEVLAAL